MSNGKNMPLVGFGSASIKSTQQIESAIVNAGYRHIDTASRYENEEFVGEAVKNAISKGVVTREDMFITTKLQDKHYEDPEKALRDSLARLELDYVDMYLIHWPNNFFADYKVPMHVLWAQMESLVEKGLTRGIGVSNFNL